MVAFGSSVRFFALQTEFVLGEGDQIFDERRIKFAVLYAAANTCR